MYIDIFINLTLCLQQKINKSQLKIQEQKLGKPVNLGGLSHVKKKKKNEPINCVKELKVKTKLIPYVPSWPHLLEEAPNCGALEVPLIYDPS